MTELNYKPTAIKLAPDLEVYCPTSGKTEARYIYKEIFEDKCYSSQGLNLKEHTTVLDVGANIGLFTRYICSQASNLTIFCFEPSPPTFECLERNTENIKEHEIVLQQVALSDRNGTAKLEFMPRAPGNSTLQSEDKHAQADMFAANVSLREVWHVSHLVFFLVLILYPFRRHLIKTLLKRSYQYGINFECPLMTLDQVIAEKNISEICLLKVDVEGEELAVLRGISDKNLEKVGQLVAEISPSCKSDLPGIIERLEKCGFSKIKVESVIPGNDPLTDRHACAIFAAKN